MNFYFNKKMLTNADVFPYIKGIHLKQLPISECDSAKQRNIIEIVDKILKIKKKNPKTDTVIYERLIDVMVYNLYALDFNEAKIIDPILSEKEFSTLK